MRTALKVVVAVVSTVYGLFALSSGLVIMTSSEMTERYVGENYSPIGAGAIGLLMASLFFASAFFIFRRPPIAVAILSALMLMQVLTVVASGTGAAPFDIITTVVLVFAIVVWRMNSYVGRYPSSQSAPFKSNPSSVLAINGREQLFCTQCGGRISTDDRYCGICGNSLQPGGRMMESEVRLNREAQGGNDVSKLLSGLWQAVVVIVGLIVVSETSMFVAFVAWRAFGPLSLILTLPFWFVYPIWWLWRYLLGILV